MKKRNKQPKAVVELTEEERIRQLLIDDILKNNCDEVEVLPSVYVYIGKIKIDSYRGINPNLRDKRRIEDAAKEAEKLIQDLKRLELLD